MRVYNHKRRNPRVFAILAVALFLLSALCVLPVTSESDAVESGTWDGYTDWTCTITKNGSSISSVTYQIGDGATQAISGSSIGKPNAFWNFDTTTGYGPFNSFYAAFDSSGKLVCHLNPYNLTVSLDGKTAISNTAYDIMWCIPTVYITASGDTLSLSSTGNDDDALAHLIDGKVWKYLGIGVYEGWVSIDKLYSYAATPTTSVSISYFQKYAAAKTVDVDGDGTSDGDSIVWNYYQWLLYRYAALAIVGNFDVQSKFGEGNSSGSRSTQGNSSTITTPYYGTNYYSTNGVKLFIENAWGNVDDYIGDAYWSAGLYAGHHGAAQVATSTNTLTKTSVESGLTGYGISGGSSSADSWGLPTTICAVNSLSSPDVMDTIDEDEGVIVGGNWTNTDACGVSCLSCDCNDSKYHGARLAYVFDSDPTVYTWTFTVNYDTGSGTGGPESETVSKTIATTEDPGYAEITISSVIPERPGYRFLGWSESENPVFGDYHAGDVYYYKFVKTYVTLHAVWTKELTLTYSGNDPSATDVPPTQTGSTSTNTDPLFETTVSTTSPRLDKHDFLGWAATTNGEVEYTGGETIEIHTDTTLYAIWKESSVTLTFYPQNGSGAETISVLRGSAPDTPDDPVLYGYAFGGWYTDMNYTTSIDEIETVDEDVSFYAKWNGILAFTTEPVASGIYASMAPNTYRFSAGASENISGASWDFGDGTTATGIYASHWYEDDGLYTVTLTVYGYNGEIDTQTFTVGVEKEETFYEGGGNRLCLIVLLLIGTALSAAIVRRFI